MSTKKSNVRFADVVRKFSGDQDVNIWLEQFELIAKLQGEENLAVLIPLFLEGAAYDVYMQLPTEQREDSDELTAALRMAFGMSPAMAFARLKSRVLISGESPDAFMADLRRLARIVARGGDEDTIDQFVVCQFVDGMPEPTRSQLRALKTGADWHVVSVLSCAKAMLQLHDEADVERGFMGLATSSGMKGSAAGRTTGDVASGRSRHCANEKSASRVRCEVCRRFGHEKSACRVRCFRCDSVGHLSRDCTAVISGNDHRGAV